jgi:alpha-beta hydrolase superfamily lysophospholipase
MHTEKIFIKNRNNLNVRVCIDTPTLDEKTFQKSLQKGLAFIMPGLGAHHNKSRFRKFAQILTTYGFVVVSFDPTNSFGESDGDYADATFTNYYEDLEDVIEWARGNQYYKEPFILIGHSLGGMGVTLYTEKYPTQVIAVAPLAATISGKLSIEARSEEEIEKWQTLGYQEKKRSNGEIKTLKWSHMEDRMKYDNLIDADKIKVPVLMVVGENDTSTPPKHQQLLFDAVGTAIENKELHIIAGADHEMNTPETEAQLIGFFEKWLVKIS